MTFIVRRRGDGWAWVLFSLNHEELCCSSFTYKSQRNAYASIRRMCDNLGEGFAVRRVAS